MTELAVDFSGSSTQGELDVSFDVTGGAPFSSDGGAHQTLNAAMFTNVNITLNGLPVLSSPQLLGDYGTSQINGSNIFYTAFQIDHVFLQWEGVSVYASPDQQMLAMSSPHNGDVITDTTVPSFSSMPFQFTSFTVTDPPSATDVPAPADGIAVSLWCCVACVMMVLTRRLNAV